MILNYLDKVDVHRAVIVLYKTPNKALSCLLLSWKKRRGDWGVKEGNAYYNNPVLFTSTDAGDRKF